MKFFKSGVDSLAFPLPRLCKEVICLRFPPPSQSILFIPFANQVIVPFLTITRLMIEHAFAKLYDIVFEMKLT